MASVPVSLPLRIGARTLCHVRRKLVRVAVTLAQGRDGTPPRLPPLADGCDGYLVTALPTLLADALQAGTQGLTPFVRQRYLRSYARLDGSFDAYLAGFSAKSRSTLKRKLRKLADRSGGVLDLRCYRRPDEIQDFYRHARSVSARSYQERLLNAGLPEGEDALAAMDALAARDSVRGWILFVDGAPVSYLYAPAEGDTLVYAYLGYDPDFAAYSPGTVLQLEAMRLLMDEGRFALFDFTEGDGQHKRQFATDALDCVDLLLVRPTPANLAAGYALNAFDGAVALVKAAFRRSGLEKLARAGLR